MKKIIGLLLISLAAFFNIDCVSAADNGYHQGTCTLENESSTSCSYTCKVTSGEQYMKFTYIVNNENNSISHTVNSAEAYTPYTENGIFSGYIGSIFGGYDNQSPISLHLEDRPLDNYFFKNGKFICRDVVTEVHATYTSDSSYTYYEHDVYIKQDPNQISSEIEDNLSDMTQESDCGLLGSKDSKTVTFVKKIYKYIKIVIPVLIVVLSIVDFLKVIVTGKDDDMKKAINKFIKRIIIAIVFILLPIILSILIDISGITSQYSGISDGLKAIACVLE